MRFRSVVRSSMVAGIVIAAMTVWALPAMASMSGNARSEAYGAIIDDMIGKCQQKSGLIDSSSQNVREDARISLMKASFYKKNREILIEEMVEKQIDARPHAVSHYLNERFFAIVRDHDPKVAEAYSEPDAVHLPRQ